jgi:rhamnosyltransferase
MKFSLFFKELYLTSHTPLRKYYKTRNRFFVADRYKKVFPAFCRADRVRFCLELLRLLFFEKNKKEKLYMLRKGYVDYRRGRLGRFDDGYSGDGAERP